MIYDRYVLPAVLGLISWTGACTWAYAAVVLRRWRFLAPTVMLSMLALTYAAEVLGQDPILTLRTIRTVAVAWFLVAGVLVPLEWVRGWQRLARYALRLRDSHRDGGH